MSNPQNTSTPKTESTYHLDSRSSENSAALRLLKSVNAAQSLFMLKSDPSAALGNLLEAMIEFTNSEFGFIGEIIHAPSGKCYLKAHAIANVAWDDESEAAYEKHQSSGLEFHNLNTLYGHTVTTGEIVLSNTPQTDYPDSGFPNGYPHISSYLGLPCIHKGKLVGVIGLANCSSGYDSNSSADSSLATDSCADILVAKQSHNSRRDIEDLLRKSTQELENFKFALDQQSVVEIADRNGVLRYVNDKACELSQFCREELVGRTHRILNSGYHPRQFFADLWETISGGGIWSGEIRNRAKDGSTYWVDSTIVPFLGPDGKPFQYISIRTDITERKRMKLGLEQMVQEQLILNQLLEIGMSHNPLGERLSESLDVIVQTSFLSLSQKGAVFVTIPGTETLRLVANHNLEEELLRQCSLVPFDKCHCGKAARSKEMQFSKCLDERHEVRFEGMADHGHYIVPLLWDNNVVGVLSLHISTGHESSETETAFLASVASILAGMIFQSSSREELLESRRNLSRAQEIAKLGHWEWHCKTDIGVWSDSAMAIFGWSSNQTDHTYKRVIARSHPDDRKLLRDVFLQALRSAQSLETEHRIVKDGIERWVLTRAEVSIDEFGKPDTIMGITQDITTRHNYEAEIARSRNLSSIGGLAGGLAHNYNNILSGIIGNTSLLKDLVAPASEVSWLVDQVEQSAFRGAQLTHELLTFATGGEPYRIDIAAGQLISGVIDSLPAEGSRRIRLEVADNLGVVKVDEAQITQALRALLNNALEATHDSGTIGMTVSTDYESSHESGSQDSSLVIVIQNSDAGVTNEELLRAFDPFYSTKPDHNGLGLSTAHSIITRHDGTLHLESDNGTGVICRITLPLHCSPELGEGDRQDPESSTVSQIKVLVMDDEEMIRTLLRVGLSKKDMDVHCSSDGAEALQMYRDAMMKGEPFDAVILDLLVPKGMGGKETIENLVELDPEVNAIVSSGYSNDPVMSDFESYGFKGCVPKPYKITEMVDVIKQITSIKS